MLIYIFIAVTLFVLIQRQRYHPRLSAPYSALNSQIYVYLSLYSKIVSHHKDHKEMHMLTFHERDINNDTVYLSLFILLLR